LTPVADRNQTIRVLVLRVMAAAICISGVGSGLHGVASQRDFLAHSASAIATVTKLTPESHNTFHYRYVVNGKPFEGFSSMSWQASPIHPGSQVPILYDTQDPSRSQSGDIEHSFQGQVFDWFVAQALFVPAFLFLLSLVPSRFWPK